MLKDMKGNRLREGDRVVIPTRIRALSGSNGRDLLLVTDELEEHRQSLIRLRGDQVLQANVPSELLFITPTFHNGDNVTVRAGLKWADVPIGHVVALKAADSDEPISLASIVGKAVMPFHLLPQELLDLEHDPTCRTRTGLMKAMKRAYPTFKPFDVVTVLIFKRV